MTVLHTIIDEVTNKYEMTGRTAGVIEIQEATDEVFDAVDEINKRDDLEIYLTFYDAIRLPQLIHYRILSDKQSIIERQKLAMQLEKIRTQLFNIDYATKLTSNGNTHLIEYEDGQHITLSIN